MSSDPLVPIQAPDVCSALQLLAQPAAVQLEILPAFTDSIDELAVDFEAAWWSFQQSGREGSLQPEQAEALAGLLALLESISGPSNPRFWVRSALETCE